VKICTFEEIIAWQKAKQLTIEIYRVFRLNKDYGFRDQVQRASVSIMNNIAEGFERQSNKEFRQFLFIAKGSSGEVRSMLLLALELSYISKTEHDQLSVLATDISRLTPGLIKTL